LLIIAVVGAVLLARRESATQGEEARERPAAWYLVLGRRALRIGAFGLLTRRSALIMFMCIELMLNAVNLTFAPSRGR